MVHNDGRSTLLGIQQKTGRQPHADVLFRIEKLEELGLVFEIRAGRIAEGIARSLILLMEEVANVRGIFARNAQLFAHLLMVEFGERLGRFHAQAVEIEIARVFAGFEKALRFDRSLRADGDQGEAEHVHGAGTGAGEEIGD